MKLSTTIACASFVPKFLWLAAALSGLALGAPPFPDFLDPNPNPGNQFGHSVLPLVTGNVVITAPFDDAGGTDAGAVYLFNGATGALISTLTGSSANDRVGFGIPVALPGGKFVISSPFWNNGSATEAGAATLADGLTGVNGVVSPANSLVGSSSGDQVGGNIVALANGNCVVASPFWDNAGEIDAGAVTFINTATGVAGAVSSSNSLVGSLDGDAVGAFGIVALPNGNYLVRSTDWNNSRGAVTFGNGSTGVSGAVSAANSLVGSTANDRVGGDVTILTNGNFVVTSPSWNHGAVADVGAATFGSGTTGVSGAVSASNSLVGTVTSDFVGSSGVVPLTNGNYVVASSLWDRDGITDVGAVTLCNGTSGLSGPVTIDNSLFGTKTGDRVGSGGVVALAGGSYVVSSPDWDNDLLANVGAVTFCNGTTGEIGKVTSGNSLTGLSPNDQVGSGRILALANGNYVVRSPLWDSGAVANVGAVTFCNGSTGLTGVVNPANSLTGSTTGDQVGSGDALALANGNYVIGSPLWNHGSLADAGAATFGNGTSGITGTVTASNSLVGASANDQVGLGGFSTSFLNLTNGNYVLVSSLWDNGSAVNAGAVTFGSATTGVSGVISAANSLVGSSSNDGSACSVTPLANGNYLAHFPLWNHGTANDAGATAFGNGVSGTSGAVSPSNSLVGSSPNDRLGSAGAAAFPNGNFAVVSPDWTNGARPFVGAATFGNGASVVSGTVTAFNSAIGQRSSANLQGVVQDPLNQTFMVQFLFQGSGKVHVGSMIDGFALTPEIAVFNGSSALPVNEREDNSGSQAFGTLAIGSSTSRSFTVQNVGTSILGGLTVSIIGPDAASFTADTSAMNPTLATGATTGFTVTFSATGSATANRSAVLRIGSTDSDENPFEIPLTATALSLQSDTDGDGLNDATEFNMAALGFNWTLAQPSLVNTLTTHIGGARSNLNAAGFFSTDQVQDLNVNTPLIQRDPLTAKFTLTLGVEKSVSLAPGSFEPLPMNGAGVSTGVTPDGRLEIEFPSTGDTGFFRLRVSEP